MELHQIYDLMMYLIKHEDLEPFERRNTKSLRHKTLCLGLFLGISTVKLGFNLTSGSLSSGHAVATCNNALKQYLRLIAYPDYRELVNKIWIELLDCGLKPKESECKAIGEIRGSKMSWSCPYCAKIHSSNSHYCGDGCNLKINKMLRAWV